MVLFNPIAGSGRAAIVARKAADAISAVGHDVDLEATRVGATEEWLDAMLDESSALVVVGGDGAVRMAAGAASRAGGFGVPIYHVPMGTENLFAREFGMDRREETLIRAIRKFDVRKIDMGVANGRTFLLMASVGYDAEVVHDLAGRRGESISHFSYIRPVVAQLWRWRAAELQVSVDGERIDDGGPGFVVVANSKHYGWRLNPCGRASMSDGQLDVAYFPTRGRRQLMSWAVRCRMHRHLRDERLVYRLGRSVKITSGSVQRYQLDGDPAGLDTGEVGKALELEIGVRERALGVLVP